MEILNKFKTMKELEVLKVSQNQRPSPVGRDRKDHQVHLLAPHRTMQKSNWTEQTKGPQLPLILDPSPSSQPSFGRSLITLCLSYIVTPKHAPSAWDEAPEQSKAILSLSQLPMLVHPRVWLALWGVRAPYWLMFNLVSTTIPYPFAWGCSPASPKLHV